MNEVEYERSEEIKAIGAAMQECLKAILADHNADSVGQLARYAYKYTDCGAAIGALIQVAGGDEPNKWVYGDDLYDLKPDAAVLALCVSSIVEGVEQCTDTHMIDLRSDEFETPQDAVNAYDAALDAVEAEAREIWDATHGCPTCAKHHGVDEYGNVAVWDECPDCKGAGEII